MSRIIRVPPHRDIWTWSIGHDDHPMKLIEKEALADLLEALTRFVLDERDQTGAFLA